MSSFSGGAPTDIRLIGGINQGSGTIDVNVFGSGTAISSVTAGGTTALDVNVTSPISLTPSGTQDVRQVSSTVVGSGTYVLVGTSASTVFASNNSRLYLGFRLVGGGTVTILPGTPPLSLQGIVLLNVGDIFDVDADNRNISNWQAISTSANSTLSIAEW